MVNSKISSRKWGDATFSQMLFDFSEKHNSQGTSTHEIIKKAHDRSRHDLMIDAFLKLKSRHPVYLMVK